MKDTKKAVSDMIAAEEIEAKKTVRKAVRTAKEAVEAAVQSDDAVAAQIEAKKTVRKAAIAVKESMESAVEDARRTARRAQLSIILCC